jgi:hypothetical protein
MIHLLKLSVGIRDIAHLAAVQQARLVRDPPLRHQTRSFPRRGPEIIDGGSIYWVIAGAIVVRQRITDIIEDRWDDDTKCAGLVLDPVLVPVEARPTRPFQGWRYLDPASAPADVVPGQDSADLPHGMRVALKSLGLL